MKVKKVLLCILNLALAFLTFGEIMVALLADWIRAIGEGGDCRNTPESTVTALDTIDSIYQSSENGHRVES